MTPIHFFQPPTRCSHSCGSDSSRRQRLGIAAVELAVSLPLLTLFTFASIELCSAIYLRQTLTIATHEGARVACHRQGSSSDASAAAQRVLDERRVVEGRIELTPSNLSRIAPGTLIKVSVAAPASSNSLLRFGLFGDNWLEADCSMLKE